MQPSTHIQLKSEPYKAKVRLVVLQNKKELACRIETFKNLAEFLQTKEARIFKGRLQLQKVNDEVKIELKSETIKTISALELRQMINACKLKHAEKALSLQQHKPVRRQN